MRLFILILIILPSTLYSQSKEVDYRGYSNEVRQTDSNPNIASRNSPVFLCSIAVSREMKFDGFRHGCRVQLTGLRTILKRLDRTDYCNGLYVINDLMHWKWSSRVDVFYFNTDHAWFIGNKQSGKIKLLWCA